MRVLVTGASGFVGQHVCERLLKAGHHVRGVSRESAERQGISGVEWIGGHDLAAVKLPLNSFDGIDSVIHLAARVHKLRDRSNCAHTEYQRANVGMTVALAEQAAAAGVRRFVFVSTAKVLGERSSQPLGEANALFPADPYARSKQDAEQALTALAVTATMQTTVVRPPLVYGPGVRANFFRLLQLAELGARVPLPLGSVENARSLIFVENLADALLTCATHSDAFGGTYQVSDGEDVSTTDLLLRLGKGLGRSVRLFRMPTSVLRGLGVAIRRSDEVRRLIESFTVDSSRIRRELGWTPPFSLDQGLRATCDWYLNVRRSQRAH